MTLAVDQHYVLPSSVPSALVWLAALAACACWVLAHFIPRLRPRWLRWIVLLGRAGIGFGAMLLVAQALQRVVLFATNWPIWPIALVTALAVEIALGLYALERRSVSRRTGLALAALRVALVLLALGMLAQPVRSVEWSQDIPRYVAVVVDDSASMHVNDTQMPVWEKLRLAETLGVRGASRPYRLDVLATELAALRSTLSEQAEWLDLLAHAKLDIRRRGLHERRKGLHEAADKGAKQVNELLAKLSPRAARGLKLTAPLQAGLADVRTKLASRVRDPLTELAKLAGSDGPDDLVPTHQKLLGSLRRAVGTLLELAPKLETLGQSLDEALYAALPPTDRQQVDAVGGQTRIELALALLRSSGPAQTEKETPALLDRLQGEYALKGYQFASTAVEADLDQWKHRPSPPTTQPASTKPARTTVPASAPTTTSATRPGGPAPAQRDEPAEAQQTNLAAALQKVISDLPAERIAGVLLLTDGRHNAIGQSAESVAQRLGALGVPVCSVLMGSSKPPVDAAIVSVDVPDTVYAKDQMYVTADLKLDGLKGKRVKVALYDEQGKEVDGNTVTVPADSFRTRVQLADTPAKAGHRQYRVAVEAFGGESFASNNEHLFTVSVTDDRVRLLMIEGRPRWEFRYVKNLFAGRDRTVRLQYVLFSPDRIPGVPQRGRVVASASAAVDKTEATALPDVPAEWMKFDVIILGDVAPQYLAPHQQEDIRKFVTDRGGTLIVVGGRAFMPRAYRGTPLAEILPVTWDPLPDDKPARAPDSFRIDLTPEGREHVIVRLGVDADQNKDIWKSIPMIHWRLAGLRAKPGATVLAYALPRKPPPQLTPKDPNDGPSQQLIRRYHRNNALITEQAAGMGQVLMLSFDRTWRMRYRTGDTYHHKFWGQVLRWATANKLPAGTSFVKMGTDRARYWPGQHVRVRAKIVAPDLTPVKSNEVAVKIFQGERLVDRKLMEYRPDSPGMYAADVGPLPAGMYTAELDAPAARDILASENAETVRTDFSVSSSTPAEQVELSADRGLLTALADLTGGTVVDAPRIAEAAAQFGPGVLVRPQRRQYVIWNHWPLLVFILLAATAEWLIRKKVGLA
ncbi:MAG TPA: hypothetical protein VNA25_13060 [Phycisphaerae bacterium]|nr:hypothetical protein [Phycisphaerae bacterium]HUT58769.1 hypothetical protein [Phycisphaerae bacterium]